MYSKDHLGKLNKVAKLLPKTMAAFRAWDAGAGEDELTEVIHVAADLRAGGAITNGAHLLEN
jgi:hypothetical protein